MSLLANDVVAEWSSAPQVGGRTVTSALPEQISFGFYTTQDKMTFSNESGGKSAVSVKRSALCKRK